MSHRTKTVSASVLLGAGALLVGVCVPSLHAAQPPGGGRKDVTELRKRVAKLEAEVAELRKAPAQAGVGTPDRATELKNVRQVAKLRAAELLQRARNTHAILREVLKAKAAGLALQNRLNDLNNELTSLWMVLAGYGLGGEPYLDNIQVSDSGFGRGRLSPDYGIPGTYAKIGLPRLQERFLEASGAKDRAADKLRADFKKLVEAYANPAVYPHRDFYERAYGQYRNGSQLFTEQYTADLQALNRWLTNLEDVLGKVPGYFEKAP